MSQISEKVKLAIRDVPDFPKEGILFKDITPILLDPVLCKEIVSEIANSFNNDFDVIVGVESRGFFFGPLLATHCNCAFVPARKRGKLPGNTVFAEYELEYGTACIEIHEGHLKEGAKVLIHDDLLATGGTAAAAAKLVEEVGAEVMGFSFLVNLEFLNGEKALHPISSNIHSICTFS